MTANPTVVDTTTSIRDAVKVMASRRFRHLPVVGDADLVGIVDITDVCRVLLEADISGPSAANTDRGGATAAAEASDPQCSARLRKLLDLRWLPAFRVAGYRRPGFSGFSSADLLAACGITFGVPEPSSRLSGVEKQHVRPRTVTYRGWRHTRYPPKSPGNLAAEMAAPPSMGG